VGSINDNDLHLAVTSKAIIYGFNVSLPSSSRQQANRDKVSIRMYNVIYELIDDVKLELSNLLPDEIIETAYGNLTIKGIFKTTRTEIICGGEVTKGKLQLPSLARIIRGDETLAEVEVTNLKRGTVNAKEILEGELCGISLKMLKKIDLIEGDKLELFSRSSVARQL
jgi:translation initiation factor IF-2